MTVTKLHVRAERAVIDVPGFANGTETHRRVTTNNNFSDIFTKMSKLSTICFLSSTFSITIKPICRVAPS